MASVEITAPTVDEAIDKALEQLGLDEDAVEIEVLAEGADGEPAHVRVTAVAESAAPTDQDQRHGTAAASGENVASGDTALAPAAGEEGWDEDLATAARETLEDLLDYLGFPGEVDILRSGDEGGTPSVAMAVVDGDSMGALIGRRGETLQALQFICQLLVNRRVGHWTRVVVDAEGYRLRRERYLKDAGLRAAERAMRFRVPVELDPMIPSERRIVHMALATHEYVTTHSEGEGGHRRIIVEATPRYVEEHGGPGEPRPADSRFGSGGGFGDSRGRSRGFGGRR